MNERSTRRRARKDPGARRGPGPTLAVRLFAAITLVIVAGAITVILVSVLIAPAVFHRHLTRAGVTLSDQVSSHVNDGFTSAVLTGIGAGVTAATAVAITVTTVVTRRITQPVIVAAHTARLLADGDYTARMPAPGVGPELAALAQSMNALAARLEHIEQHREKLMIDIAHELRTPLAALEATVEAIADGVLPADEETLTSLTEQTARLTRLTGDLAAVSRSDEHAFTIRRRPADLSALAATCVRAHVAAFAGAGVRLLPPDGPPLTATVDPDRINEIIDQLLSNALRHCRPGDTVTVTVQAPATPARRGDRGSPSAAQIVVTDTGTGFDPDRAEALFTRFYRAPRAAGPDPDQRPGANEGGSGVGLTIARGLAEAHGGTLTATSDGPGHGATFILTIPR